MHHKSFVSNFWGAVQFGRGFFVITMFLMTNCQKKKTNLHEYMHKIIAFCGRTAITLLISVLPNITSIKFQFLLS